MVDVTPTHGVNKMSGTVRKGADVRRDELNQQFDSAVQPLTGKSHVEMNIERKRVKLTPGDKLRCKTLDLQLPVLERRAQAATGEAKAVADESLLEARKEFFWLKC